MFHNRAISLLFDSLNAVYSFLNSFKPLFRVHLQQKVVIIYKISQPHVFIKETEATGCIYSKKIQASQKSEKETEKTEQL